MGKGRREPEEVSRGDALVRVEWSCYYVCALSGREILPKSQNSFKIAATSLMDPPFPFPRWFWSQEWCGAFLAHFTERFGLIAAFRYTSETLKWWMGFFSPSFSSLHPI